MKFCAAAMPIEAPTPAAPPPPRAREAATTAEEIFAVLVASSFTSPALSSTLSSA
ncbi:MAG: hypothetical protein BWX88_03615 [Planctomycetes bacterium ADurb.Bin126]|nr:MAG: hypothetical protein BWX88_03615 [Planctomycetes bacterium ADurb.Bin126]